MKAALYARVSDEEQVEGYSLDAQRRAFRSLVESRDWTIYNEYVEEGKSARTEHIDRRPVFKQVIADALGHKYDILVVHKLDRFSRNLRVTLEYFDKLLKAGITFFSISEQMDFTTPSGKVHLALLGAFAQYYSDNLSQETKKGWDERRKQGLYCGALPFGAMKGEDGVPVPDKQERRASIDGNDITVHNYEGLKMVFDLAAQGRSDRQVAMALNTMGYRTTGTHGSRPFSKDTVKDMLVNRFYVGHIPDRTGGWLTAKHKPLIDLELFETIQRMRQKNRKSTHRHSSETKNVYSLTGITYCWYCRENDRQGRIHISCVKDGKPRMGCYNRAKGWDCPQKSALLETYEQQLRAYLGTFLIPEDYQQRILQMHQELQQNYDVAKEHKQLTARMHRLKELYKWGDINRDEYKKETEQIQRQLVSLTPFQGSDEPLQRLAEFLANITTAWDQATNEQRNKLARCLFQEIWVKDKDVVAVKPQPEFEPFFKLNWKEFSKVMKSRAQCPPGSH